MTRRQHYEQWMKWISQQVKWFLSNQKVVLLSLADSEGPSDFTRVDPLLLMSSPWKRPSWSFCNISDSVWELVWCSWWVGIVEGEWPNDDNWMFWWPEGPDCDRIGLKVDPVNGIWCIPKLKDSVWLIISPVATLSLSTSFFNASLRATTYQKLISVLLADLNNTILKVTLKRVVKYVFFCILRI